MHELLILIALFTGGMVLGVVYFSGLWFTVRHVKNGEHPAFWLILSLILRMALLLTAFYLILSFGHWKELLVVLAGFVFLRILSVRSMRRQISASTDIREKQL
ncbi:ATP synthase subunit I [Nitrosomonas marina]|uniref:F1/F0 ATPase, subunit 2 n=1 Tax=Nitrosomonas marina TaxID=917 RepID=A0A1H8GQR5_9PROT|nr:ATP synthase subunit I [Nitrosomonas marina]SEN46074.1 F1/F0 ATPase, subunit 2 [Nitrosomonas marina]